MPGSSSRPGDVVKALERKIRRHHEYRRRRPILGDAMTYAERLGATHIADAATPTGAVSRAFGQ
jgi:leucyl aminopeptidase